MSPGSTTGLAGGTVPCVSAPATVVANRAARDFRVMTLDAGLSAGVFRPGHRVAVRVGDHESALLARRSLWVYGVQPRGSDGGTVDVVVGSVERGASWLARQEPGSTLEVVGPVGRPFPLPITPVGVVLVGVGQGSAPLFWLGNTLRERGCHVEVVLVGEKGGDAFGVDAAEAALPTCSVTLCEGAPELPEVVGGVVSKSHASVVYGCGPWESLELLHGVGERMGVTVFVALSELLGCGVGLCGGCVLPVQGKDGVTRMVRACVEGPVFRSGRLRWDAYEDGWCMVPHDAVGADAMGWV